MDDLTPDEARTLRWLGQKKYSQYGECHGPALDGLIAKGLAQLHPASDPETIAMTQAGFISRGRSRMFWAVSLTDAGRKLIDG